MDAILLEKPRDFRMTTIPAAASPGPGEALVKVHRVGICGTDISGYLGKSERFDAAMAAFGAAYADQNERDYKLLLAAVKQKRIAVGRE